MPAVVEFFVQEHDARFILLAALVCLIACHVCMSLLRHARQSRGRMRQLWHLVGAATVGFGIWATHFVAMLAHRPGFELSYDLPVTMASLGVAILLSGLGLGVAIYGSRRSDSALGGAIVGIGISAMHYLGMSGLVLGGTIGWDPAGIAASVLASMGFGTLALWSSGRKGQWSDLVGALWLTIAICGLHFTAMAAADFSRCFPLGPLAHKIDTAWMSLLVAGAGLLILLAALGSIALDAADRRRSARELARQARDAERLARMSDRLELALGNMSQGLCLFNAAGAVELYNGRVLALLDLPVSLDLQGASFADICRRAVADPSDEDELQAVIDRHELPCRQGGTLVHDLGTRTIQVTHNPIDGGGWVTTIDDITERRRSESAIAHLAMHDVLTDLPNRANFEKHLHRVLAEVADGGSQAAVLQIDLNNFKEVNVSHWHAAGDNLLIALASRLKALVQEGEMVARIGGDEFAAFLPFAGMEQLQGLLDRLEGALSGTVSIEELSLPVSASIGVSVYPQDALNSPSS